MAVPSCRAVYGADNVGSMNGIERLSTRDLLIYREMEVRIINATAKG